MIKIDSLQDLVKFTSLTKNVNCYSAWREQSGKKIIFSVTKNAKIVNYNIVGTDAMTIEYMTSAATTKHWMTHQIHLSGLRMINIYEVFTEYLTNNRIDFMHVMKGGPTFTLLSALDLIPVPIPLAQWVYEDEQLDDTLDYLGQTVIKERQEPDLRLDFS